MLLVRKSGIFLKFSERVCDTVYQVETDEDTREDVQCVQGPSYSCHHEERTVYDRVCRHQTKYHDCGSGHEDQSECETQTEVSCHDTPKVVEVLVCSEGEEQVQQALFLCNICVFFYRPGGHLENCILSMPRQMLQTEEYSREGIFVRLRAPSQMATLQSY